MIGDRSIIGAATLVIFALEDWNSTYFVTQTAIEKFNFSGLQYEAGKVTDSRPIMDFHIYFSGRNRVCVIVVESVVEWFLCLHCCGFVSFQFSSAKIVVRDSWWKAEFFGTRPKLVLLGSASLGQA